jgi:hypothetical protein
MCRSISGFLSARVIIAVLPFISGIVTGVGIGYVGLSMPIVLALIASLERYLDLLEKAFIIKKFGAFSRNLRSEINKSARALNIILGM